MGECMRHIFFIIPLMLLLAYAPAHAAEVSCLKFDAANTELTDKNGGNVAPPDAAAHSLDPNDWKDIPCVEGLLKGTIMTGDYDKILVWLRFSHPMLDSFALLSPGGSVEEAMMIGRLFRKYTIAVLAPVRLLDGSFEAFGPHGAPLLCVGSSECDCASAC